MKKRRKKAPGQDLALLPQGIHRYIYLVRSQKVLLDVDLAGLYQVTTKAFNQAVKRNLDRFPEDFMFRLTPDEALNLRSQFVTSSGHGGSRYLPFAFTEHGITMLSSVLRSKRAVKMNILIVRTFVKLREMFLKNRHFAARLEKLETNQKRHASVITILAEEIEDLKTPVDIPLKHRVGFLNQEPQAPESTRTIARKGQ